MTSPPAGGDRRRGPLRWLPLLALVIVAAVALTVGAHRPVHETIAQQTASIEGQVKCPVCSGETVAESATAISADIRDYIKTSLQQGQSRQQILDHLTAVYGPSVLEKPSANGIDLLLWVLPVIAVLLALGGLTIVFTRWRLRRAVGVSDDDRRLVGRILAGSNGSGSGTNGSAGGADGRLTDLSAAGSSPSVSDPHHEVHSHPAPGRVPVGDNEGL